MPAGRPKGGRNRRVSRACVECGTEFMSGWATAQTCSQKCYCRRYRRAHATPVLLPCAGCGQQINARTKGSRRARCSVCVAIRQRTLQRNADRERCATPQRKAHFKDQQAKRKRAKGRYSDLDATLIATIMAGRTYCPLCKRKMRAEHGYANSKQLDHIVPLAAGGTHTQDNVRPVCRDCNLRRPKDGSDVSGQVSLVQVG